MLKIDIISLLPDIYPEFFNNLPYKRAFIKQLADIKVHNLRDYGLDNYGTVDGKPYGGGVGMILMVEPVYNVLCDIYQIERGDGEFGAEDFLKRVKDKEPDAKIVLLDPRGTQYTQNKAKEYSGCPHLTLICGRYEGADERIGKYLCTDRISVGNYILSGGEAASLVITESVVRLLPDVLEKREALSEESFTESPDDIEYPQYTRPENFRGLSVPEILLSGNHGEISKWKKANKKKSIQQEAQTQ